MTYFLLVNIILFVSMLTKLCKPNINVLYTVLYICVYYADEMIGVLIQFVTVYIILLFKTFYEIWALVKKIRKKQTKDKKQQLVV